MRTPRCSGTSPGARHSRGKTPPIHMRTTRERPPPSPVAGILSLITSLPRTSSVTTRLERPKAPAGKPGPRRATVSTRPPTFSGPPRAPRGPREERACAASSPRAMPRRRTSARMRLSRKRGRRVCRGPASEPRRIPRASSTPPLRRSGSEGPHHDLLVSTCK